MYEIHGRCHDLEDAIFLIQKTETEVQLELDPLAKLTTKNCKIAPNGAVQITLLL
eukprot:m.78041 g.78041  ORF g.78041 m.78041 type:complete len:55 (+) comp12654_c0_seq2:1808-1972(+)